ncbi:MAG: hypothetical protein ACRDXX_13065 [Stackebrandtia sp.]
MKRRLGLLAAFATVAIALFAATPAQASPGAQHIGDETQSKQGESPGVTADDSFWTETTDSCGIAGFIDYGEGKPGGGNNDDYIEITDDCPDGAGVRARVWVDDDYQGKAYSTGGWGETVVWDPFPNVKPGEIVDLEVCMVDDGDVYECGSAWNGPIDG